VSQIRLDEVNYRQNKQATTGEAAAAEPLIEVKNLGVIFSKEVGFLGHGKKTTEAVNGVSFELYPSETLSLIGESGSGKTTVARCITLLEHPTTGTIKYCGKDLGSIEGKERRDFRKQVQMVFQDPFQALNPFLNVSDFLGVSIRHLLGVRERNKIIQTERALLDEVGLVADEILPKFQHELSGGEMQRVNIARALASRPRVLVADEPVSMLDAPQRLKTLDLLLDLQKNRDLSILMITHDLAVAQVMGGRTAVMYLGKLCEIGPTNEILLSPRHPYTELLLSAAPSARDLFGINTRDPELGDESSRGVAAGSLTIEGSKRLTQGCSFRNRCRYSTTICAEQSPALTPTSDRHAVACYNPCEEK
jgi:oligopeptide/dipeptide ABC transporter ATP-binding protein